MCLYRKVWTMVFVAIVAETITGAEVVDQVADLLRAPGLVHAASGNPGGFSGSRLRAGGELPGW